MAREKFKYEELFDYVLNKKGPVREEIWNGRQCYVELSLWASDDHSALSELVGGCEADRYEEEYNPPVDILFLLYCSIDTQSVVHVEQVDTFSKEELRIWVTEETLNQHLYQGEQNEQEEGGEASPHVE